MAFRIGQFFVFMGLLLFLIFYASYAGNRPEENFFGWGLLCLAGGAFLMYQNRKPAGDVERFRGIRSYRQRQEARRKEREEKRKAKEAARQAKKKK
ncbi:MAG: hypothetical protein ACOYYS_22720 [Chloroflexota bacterium]